MKRAIKTVSPIAKQSTLVKGDNISASSIRPKYKKYNNDV